MSIISVLSKLEHAIVSYADEAGKTVEKVGEELLEFIEGKKNAVAKQKANTEAQVAAANQEAAGSGVDGLAAGAPKTA